MFVQRPRSFVFVSLLTIYVLTMHLFALAVMQGLHVRAVAGPTASETLRADGLCLSGEEHDEPAGIEFEHCVHWCCTSAQRPAAINVVAIVVAGLFRPEIRVARLLPEIIPLARAAVPGTAGRPRGPPSHLV